VSDLASGRSQDKDVAPGHSSILTGQRRTDTISDVAQDFQKTSEHAFGEIVTDMSVNVERTLAHLLTGMMANRALHEQRSSIETGSDVVGLRQIADDPEGVFAPRLDFNMKQFAQLNALVSFPHSDLGHFVQRHRQQSRR